MSQDPRPARPSSTGTVTLEANHANLTFERILRHPPAAVWEAITRPEELASWYLAKATIDGRRGGTVDLHTGPSQFHVTGRILVWDPPRTFEHEWRVAPRPELPEGEEAVIRWELEPVPEGTRLTLTHRRLTRATALGFAPGTHALLDRLEAYLDRTPLPAFGPRYQEVLGNYPPMPKARDPQRPPSST